MALAVPHTLSPSKVASFKGCALNFRFSVIDKLPEPPSPAAARGTLVHRALERLHCRPADERTVDAALADLATATDEVLGSDEYRALVLDDREEFLAGAGELVRRYFRLEDPRTVHAIGLELKMEAAVGSLRLRGVIDRLELDEHGELVVTDYKTGRAPTVRYEQGRLDGVQFYAYLCESVLGRRPARIQLLHLADPVAIVATPSDQSVRGLEGRVDAIWQAVRRACEREDFRPNPGPLCEWCSFKTFCPAFGGDPAAARGQLFDVSAA